MFRRLASVLCLVFCLNLLVDSANPSSPCAGHPSPVGGFPADENRRANAEQTLTGITPYQESAWFSADAKLAGFLNHPLLITGDPALVQLHLQHITQQRWQRFGAVPTAPFVFSRSLPLQI